MRMPLAGPGPFMVLGALLLAAPALYFDTAWAKVLAGLGVFFALFCAYFFRDPERTTPVDPQAIYSPGDGTVLSVRKEGPGEMVTVRIFLSIFNVHVQRSPIKATIAKVHEAEGTYAMAMKEYAKDNARTVVTFQDGDFGLIVEQITGFVARRIKNWVKAGDRVEAGQRYGMIYFGSQCAVHLPGSCKIKVGVGDKVTGGVTVIAER